MTTEERFERIESNLEATTQGLKEFQAAVRGAFTVQQQQIADLSAGMKELRETVNQLAREWQAYLRTIHPPQQAPAL